MKIEKPVKITDVTTSAGNCSCSCAGKAGGGGGSNKKIVCST